VTAYTSINNAEEFKGEKFREITLGTNVLDTIEVSKDASHSYFFTLDIPETTEKDANVIVKLSPIKGKFMFCVSANNTKIEDEKDCTWDDYNFDGVISFGSKDTLFGVKKSYGILVKPIFDKAFKGQVFSYNLLVMSPTEYSSLLLGQEVYYNNVATSEIYVQTSVAKNSKYFAFLLMTNDPGYEVMVTNDRDDFSVSAPSEFAKTASGKRSAVYYNVDALAKLCEPYERVYKSKADMVA
jgi:hypothetical protein